MPLGPDRINWYEQGIRRAEQDGLIHYARKNIGAQFVVSDDYYSHLCREDGAPLVLRYTNTRPLSFAARHILNLYRSNADVRVLELGPGAGVACATASHLLPDAEIDTVSLTPLNPYLRFRWDDIHARITEPISHETCRGLYRPCLSPFVRNQYIGAFPQAVSLRRESYHFIYENHGAIFYNLHPYRHGEPMHLARASLSSTLPLLRRDGTMLIMASDGWHMLEDALESATTSTDVIVTCKRTTGYHSFPCLVARQESPLSKRLRENKSGLLPGSGRVFRLDFQAFEQVISNLCA